MPRLRKNLSALLLVLPFVIFISGCCTLILCNGIDTMDSILFRDFDGRKELNVVVVKKYTSNTNFSTMLDSMVVSPDIDTTGSVYQRVLLPVNLSKDYDYRIELPDVGLTYELTDFQSEKRSCNSGTFCFDSYNALTSYRVNGEVVNTGSVVISK